MKRIIMHWTAGSYTPNSVDKKAYHYLIDGAGNVHNGVFPVSANDKQVSGSNYAAHTYNCNSYSVGVSVCAMHGAVESPFNKGTYPITAAQEAALVKLVASLSKQYAIPITPTTVLTHAEVQENLKIPQKNKWDITYLPSIGKVSAKVAGDKLRQDIQKQLAPKPVSFWEWLKAFMVK